MRFKHPRPARARAGAHGVRSVPRLDRIFVLLSCSRADCSQTFKLLLLELSLQTAKLRTSKMFKVSGFLCSSVVKHQTRRVANFQSSALSKPQSLDLIFNLSSSYSEKFLNSKLRTLETFEFEGRPRLVCSYAHVVDLKYWSIQTPCCFKFSNSVGGG